ncbi:MAG: VWA domain-containing protein [Elusimicrobia bacterium]|nr:VWA domain-containing protein [Elusimicrobiota bacterium]
MASRRTAGLVLAALFGVTSPGLGGWQAFAQAARPRVVSGGAVPPAAVPAPRLGLPSPALGLTGGLSLFAPAVAPGPAAAGLPIGPALEAENPAPAGNAAAQGAPAAEDSASGVLGRLEAQAAVRALVAGPGPESDEHLRAVFDNGKLRRVRDPEAVAAAPGSAAASALGPARAVGHERSAVPVAAPDAAAPEPGDGAARGGWSRILDVVQRSFSSTMERGRLGWLARCLGAAAQAFADDNGDKENKKDISRLPIERQIDILMDRYKVPPADRARRKQLTLDAISRVRADIALFAGPSVRVQTGTWWLTVQNLKDPENKEIRIPVEDIFVRAVDAWGEEEAVGAAIHEVAHYSITRLPPDSALAGKYALGNSPKANNALFQAIEDTRVNTWALKEKPGFQHYLDAVYAAEWPEDLDDKKALARARIRLLQRSTIEVEHSDGSKEKWVPPHLQYVDSIIYYWRHGKAPKFLEDQEALKAWEATLPALEAARNLHPEKAGDVLLEAVKAPVGEKLLELIDREIYPYYEKLVEKTKQEMRDKQQKGDKMQKGSGQSSAGEDGEEGDEDGQDQDGQGGQGGRGKSGKSSKGGGSSGSSSDLDELLDEINEDVAKALKNNGGKGSQQKSGSQGASSSGSDSDGQRDQGASAGGDKQAGEQGDEQGENSGQKDGKGNKDKDKGDKDGKDGKKDKDQDADKKDGKGDEAGDGDGSDGRDDDSFLKRRERAIQRAQERLAGWTTYERYRMRAHELQLINKVDGIIKKILLPTKHARLSRQFYEDGDEINIPKYYDDLAQGRYDTPVMQRWNRKIRRSAKISLVLDISGSMGRPSESMDNPIDHALVGIVAWIEVCQKNNLDFEMIVFDNGVHTIHTFGKPLNKFGKEGLLQDVIKLSGGSTAIGAAFKAALDSIVKQQATHRFIVFATDEGQNTGESPEKYVPEAKKKKVVTMALVIGGAAEGYKKIFDYAVRVEHARDFASTLLEVLKAAVKAILGSLALLR